MDFLSILLPYIPSFVLRRFYSEQTLAQQIKVAISDDGRGVFLNGGDIPCVNVYLTVINLSAFEVTVEALWCQLQFLGGRLACPATTLREIVKPHSTKNIHLEASMTEPQRDFINRLAPEEIEKHVKDRQFRIDLTAELNCRVRRFQLFGRELSTVNVEFVNFSYCPRI